MNQPAAAVAVPERPVATAINRNYLGDEEQIVRELADARASAGRRRERIAARAAQLVEGVRTTRVKRTGLDAFLRQYDLSSQEGVILMCLAEALLRIPDDATADKLIADKISAGDWAAHLGDAESLFVNASTWGLMLTGQHRAAERCGHARSARRHRAHRGPPRRAGAAHRVPAGHAHHGPPVRHGPHDRGSAGALGQRARTARTAIRSTCSAKRR